MQILTEKLKTTLQRNYGGAYIPKVFRNIFHKHHIKLFITKKRQYKVTCFFKHDKERRKPDRTVCSPREKNVWGWAMITFILRKILGARKLPYPCCCLLGGSLSLRRDSSHLVALQMGKSLKNYRTKLPSEVWISFMKYSSH